MVGKTKKAEAQKGGARLQVKNNKWYRYIAQTQLFAFAAMHLILGLYFVFVSSEYANHPGFSATIKDHRKMDQIFGIVCFVLAILWMNLFSGLKKNKKIALTYYVGMAVSVALPFVYFVLSDNYIIDAMRAALEADADIIVNGVGDTNEITFWAGFNFGMWENSGDFNSQNPLMLDYLAKLGLEGHTEIALAEFDMAGLVDIFRTEKYSWNKFELYAIINAVLSAAFVACTIFFIPMKEIKLPKLFAKKDKAPKEPKAPKAPKAPKEPKAPKAPKQSKKK